MGHLIFCLINIALPGGSAETFSDMWFTGPFPVSYDATNRRAALTESGRILCPASPPAETAFVPRPVLRSGRVRPVFAPGLSEARGHVRRSAAGNRRRYRPRRPNRERPCKRFLAGTERKCRYVDAATDAGLSSSFAPTDAGPLPPDQVRGRLCLPPGMVWARLPGASPGSSEPSSTPRPYGCSAADDRGGAGEGRARIQDRDMR